MRRVLVSGGAGFIGASLVRELAAGGVDCTVADDLSADTGGRLARLAAGPRPALWRAVDVTRPGGWASLLRHDGPFDAIVHLAARVGVRRVLADPAACRVANLAGVGRLVEALAGLSAAERPRVFAASTSEVYREKRGALREDDALRPREGRGRWAYAGSKRGAEEMLDAARELWPPDASPLHLRFFNVVGPGQDARGGMVLPTFVEHALAGRPLPVHGQGTQVRSFAHVDDVARALAWLVQGPPAYVHGALNVGATTRASVLELARTVLSQVPGGGMIRFVDPRRHVSPRFEEVDSREPDLSRALRSGLPLVSRPLIQLVADCVARHGALSIGTSLDTPGPRAGDGESAAIGTGAVPCGSLACASPAS